VDLGLDLLLGWTLTSGPDSESKSDILKHRHVAEESVMLKHKAHPAIACRAVGSVLAIKQHSPGIGEIQSGDDAEKSRLPGAGGAQ
jgi:hypothetical protein